MCITAPVYSALVNRPFIRKYLPERPQGHHLLKITPKSSVNNACPG